MLATYEGNLDLIPVPLGLLWTFWKRIIWWKTLSPVPVSVSLCLCLSPSLFKEMFNLFERVTEREIETEILNPLVKAFSLPQPVWLSQAGAKEQKGSPGCLVDSRNQRTWVILYCSSLSISWELDFKWKSQGMHHHPCRTSGRARDNFSQYTTTLSLLSLSASQI